MDLGMRIWNIVHGSMKYQDSYLNQWKVVDDEQWYDTISQAWDELSWVYFEESWYHHSLNQVFKWRIFSARPMGVYEWCRFLRGVSQVLDTPWHEKQLVRRYGRFQCNRRVSEFSLIQEYKSHQKSWHLRPTFFKHHIPGFHVSQEPPGPVVGFRCSKVPITVLGLFVSAWLQCLGANEGPGPAKLDWVTKHANGSSLGLRDGMVFRSETSNSFGSLILKFWPMHLIT